MQRGVLALPSLIVAVVLLSIGGAHASSINAHFNAINSSVGINQYAYFNFSGDFQNSSNYTIYFGNTPILSGNIPANSAQNYVVKYNVTNTKYGSYKPYIKFSTIVPSLSSNLNISILPTPDLSFSNVQKYTYAFNKSITMNNLSGTKLEASLTVSLLDSGNTPLNITWSIPSVNGVSFSLDYVQSFDLEPGKSFSIPMNLTLASSSSRNVNFSFLANFSSQQLRRNYITTLVSPIVNLSFYNGTITTVNSNESVFSASIINGNNVPINATFSFLLDINGGSVVYNSSETLSTSSTYVSIPIPNVRVISATVFYPSQNGTVISSQVYYNPLPPSPLSFLDVFVEYSYLIVFGIAIIILVIIQLGIHKKKNKKI